MKNTITALVLLVFCAAAWASTSVSEGDELDYFSQLIDVFTIRIGETTVNAGIIAIGIVAFCAVVGIATLTIAIAGFILQKKK